MASPLDFPNTETFRKALIVKNLKPYRVPGVYTPPSGPTTYETVLNNLSVTDSPQLDVISPIFANQLYPLSPFGPQGGYNQNINYNGVPIILPSNAEPYDYSYAKIDLGSQDFLTLDQIIPNLYSNPILLGGDVEANRYFISPNPLVPEGYNFPGGVPHQQYWYPPSFVPSTYTPYQILIFTDPSGDNGRLSQDSYIARLGAKELNRTFKENIGRNIERLTISRFNIDALRDPFEAAELLKGNVPLIERDYRITKPQNVLGAAADYLQRLGGFYFPASMIPGDYFLSSQRQPTTIQQITRALGVTKVTNALGIGSQGKYGSELFLQFTGGGQKSKLFKNLDFNKYKPDYNRGIIANLGNFLAGLVGGQRKPSNSYIGSPEVSPNEYDSPSNAVPKDEFGIPNGSIVYGPDVQGKDFENNLFFQFGYDGKAYIDKGGIAGGFVWTTSKYQGDIGWSVGPGGKTFEKVTESLDPTYIKSTGYENDFRNSSILDQTQKLMESADLVGGLARRRHVGNAINQISKVFDDGYKELTKGSRVIAYRNQSGVLQGAEYCRIFQKDTPYLRYSDLQKTDGITNSGRRFSYSVLDNTYNLNITPLKNPGSTNIIDGKVKKYMFSIENLAWRTSNRPGFTYDELPECEKGPNGGRIMWFPPYDIKFSESTSANWNPTSFLGRPEPVYTYKDTSRSGTLSWKIIVDHPSILNAITKYVLANERNSVKVNSILDSFFAGCTKFDIYELAKRYYTIPVSLLTQIQNGLNNPSIQQEELEVLLNNIPSQNTGQNNGPLASSQSSADGGSSQFNASEFDNMGLYFDNDIPSKGSAPDSYNVYYDIYTSQSNIDSYVERATTENKEPVKVFFNEVVKYNYELFQKFFKDTYNYLSTNPTAIINLDLAGSASAPNTKDYNVQLSERRINSVIKFLETYQFNTGSTQGDQVSLKQFIDNKRLLIKNLTAQGEEVNNVTPKSKGTTFNAVSCTDEPPARSPNRIYSPTAMACRSVRTRVSAPPIPPPVKPVDPEVKPTANSPLKNVIRKPSPRPDLNTVKANLSKKILRYFLSECDYFEVVKESNPTFYDDLREQIKYFSPSFHSMTPEGLNARLTFLQQCMRPGDTIPTVGPDGQLLYNEAVNTAFGSPPVLVLRIGDFYNTKIVANGLQISYEPLVFDLNPEGIGVQPMIANITLSFNFIGGSGLASPVEQLQNALSFNYYANTEIYDERSTVTEPEGNFQKEFVDAILNKEPLVTINNIEDQKQNPGGNAIGQIDSSVVTTSGETGTLNYKQIMDDLLSNSATYFNNVFNKIEQVQKNYNNGILQVWFSSRNYTKGDFFEYGVGPSKLEVNIYGKSTQELQSKVNKIFNDIKSDIQGVNSANDAGFGFIKLLYERKVANSNIRIIKRNMVTFIENLRNTFIQDLINSEQELVNFEQNYVQIIRKLNLVTSSTDGKIKENTVPQILNISGTTEVNPSSSPATNTFDELVNDMTTVGNNLNTFNTQIIAQNILVTGYTAENGFTPLTSTFTDIYEKRFYTIMCQTIIDPTKLQTFKNATLKDVNNKVEGESVETIFDFAFADVRRGNYNAEQAAYQKNVTDFKNSPNNTTFYKGGQISYTPYISGKTRKFTYSTLPAGTNQQIERIKNLYTPKNINNDKNTFNGKIKFT